MFLKISDYYSKNIATIPSDSLISDVLKVFLRDQIDITCVVDREERLIGIISKNSLLREVLNGKDIHSSITPLIRRQVVTLDESDFLEHAREILLEQSVSHGVVIDRKNHVKGIVKKSDIIRGFLHEKDLLLNQLSGLIENLQDAVISVDTKQCILTFNRIAEEMFDLKKNQMLNTPIKKWFPELTQDFQKTIDSKYPSQPKQINLGRHIVIASFIPITHQNIISGSMVVLQDVTKLEAVAEELESTKRLQRTLHHALTLSYDAIIITDAKGIITIVNDAFANLFEITREGAMNQHWSKIIPDLSLDHVLQGKKVKGKVHTIDGRPCFVTQEPIMQSHRFVGSITKIIFRQLDEWKDVFHRLEELESELSYYRGKLKRVTNPSTPFSRIISTNTKINQLKRHAMLAAKGSSTILITGESGTGKELFAEAIHEQSERAGEFVKINCAAVPADLIESEFFGYSEGAFTGAKKGGKPGKFEIAHKGTLFLDEIGDMPLSLQAKLLRVLQEQTFERIGDTNTRSVDIRIITATNKNLLQMVQEGSFREDLYYRIDVINFHLPSLRERLDDIPLLSDYLIKKLNKKLNKNIIGITPETLDIFQSYEWPGNIRQLENVLERACNLGIVKWIQPDHIPDTIEQKHHTPSLKRTGPVPQEKPKTIEQSEKKLIIQTLKKVNHNRSETARLLGISRSTLYQKIKKYGIHQEIQVNYPPLNF